MRTLIKTDKNSTKYYRVREKCGKCHGTGHIDYYNFYDGGICFDCNGSGFVEYNEVERTPEYEKKLEDRRNQKALREAPNKNEKLIKSMHLSESGSAFCVKGDTYEIREELKAAGAHYNSSLGWFFSSPSQNYETFEVSIDQMTDKDCFGAFWFNGIKAREAIITANEVIFNSNFVGEINAKIEVNAKLERNVGFDGSYGWVNCYIFRDERGNKLIWKTSAFIDHDWKEGVLKGTVKDHSTYQDEKQTELIRCKLS